MREDQHDIERQHIEIDRLELQHQGLPDHHVGPLEKQIDVVLIAVHRVVEAPRGARDLRNEKQKQENMGDVELPGALQQALGGGEELPAGHRRTVDEAGGVSGNEHKELGGVAEAKIAQRQPADDVVGNVIEENHPLSDAPHQIKPQIPLGRAQETITILSSHPASPSSLPVKCA
jgi:hypothetical protein